MMKYIIIIGFFVSVFSSFGQDTELSSFLSNKFSLVPGDTFSMGTVFRLPVKDENHNSLMTLPSEMKTAGAYEGMADEKPHHLVELDSFYLAKCEVSYKDFARFMELSGYTTTAEQKGYSTQLYFQPAFKCKKVQGISWKHDLRGKLIDSASQNCPVVHVSFIDALHYCNWLSEQQGLEKVYQLSDSTINANWQAAGFRLPTEAEWEFAAREGGKMRRYGNGKNIADPKEINFDGWDKFPLQNAKSGIRRNKTLPVGSLPPNALALYDMSGNVNEWCWDWYSEDYYQQSPRKNPKGPPLGKLQNNPYATVSGYLRVCRGGASELPAAGMRCSNREYYKPNESYSILGFRIAKNK